MFQYFFLFLPVIVCLVLAVLIFFKENRKKTDIVACFAFFLSAIALYSYSYYYQFDYKHFYIYDIICNYALLLAITTLSFYISLLTRYTIDYSKVLLLYLPAIVLPTFIMILYLSVGYDNVVLFTMSSFYRLPIDMPYIPDFKWLDFFATKLINYVEIAYFLSFAIDSLISLRRYYRDLDNFYSSLDTKKNDIKWVVVWLVLIFSILCLTLCFGTDLNIYKSPYVIRFIYLLYSIFFVILGRKMLYLKYTAEDFLSALKTADSMFPLQKEVPNTELCHAQDEIDKNLLELMEKKHIFLTKNLSLNDVALALNTNRSYASRIINKKYNKTFAEFINKYRIEYAQSLIAENSKMPMEEVADKSGFSTYMSFYRAFISIVGIPPKEIASVGK